MHWLYALHCDNDAFSNFNCRISIKFACWPHGKWVFSDHKFCMKLAIWIKMFTMMLTLVRFLIWGDRRSDETFYIVQWWYIIRCAKFGFGNRWNVFKSLFLNSLFIIMLTYCRVPYICKVQCMLSRYGTAVKRYCLERNWYKCKVWKTLT